jgi:phosphohistidine phosphatase
VQPRRVLLIRHAKAADARVDLDRPLAGRGTRQAAAIGAWLEETGRVPDRVVVSPARRAAQTWDVAAARLRPHVQPVVDPRIYDNGVEALLAVVRETPGDVRTVAVVGHNPSIGELAAALDDGRGDPAARRAVESGFPTAGVAVFSLAGPFADIAPGTATLDDFTAPHGRRGR